MQSPIDSRSMNRLIELSESEGYQRCLQRDTALHCSLVRDRATEAIETERAKNEER